MKPPSYARVSRRQSKSKSSSNTAAPLEYRSHTWLNMLLRQAAMRVAPSATCVSRILVLGILVSCFAGMRMSGQIKSAAIDGLVTDPSGSVVAGAQLVVTEQGTKISQNAVSTSSGEFVVPYLMAGTYTVEVKKQGFKSIRVSDITLTVGQQYQLNVNLSLGSVTETVNVASNAAQLQTESATVQSTVGEAEIKSIPNTNQNPLYYATLQAGVAGRSEMAQTQSTQSFGIGFDGRRNFSAFNMNGGGAFTNDIQLDGLTVLGSGFHEATVLPNTDALQEVRVITSDYSADLGRGQGVVQMATKSGTDAFHASIYYRMRNDALNANSYQNNYNGISRGSFKVNDAGGTFGGPILRGKIFIFTSFEQLLHHDAPEWLLSVPTAAQRTGDFSQTLIAGQGGLPIAATIYNPYAVSPAVGSDGTPIPGVYERAIYPNAIIPNPSQQALTIMGAYPLPNRTPSDVYNSNNFLAVKSRSFSRESSNSRLDYHPNQKHSFYVSGGVEVGSIKTPSPYGANSPFYVPPTSTNSYGGVSEPEVVQDDNPYLSLGDTIILNPTTVLDIRYGIERVHMNYLSNSSTSLTASDYSSYGMPANVQSLLPLFGAAPDISPGGFSPLNSTQYDNKRERQTNQQVVGGITKTLGQWTLRAGSEYRVDLSNYNDFQEAAGEYGYSGTPTAQFVDANGNTTAQDVLPTQFGFGGATLLTGEGGWNTFPAAAARLALAQKYFAVYSQNDWHPNSKLVVNVGLRWEVQPGPTERYNRSGAIDLTKTNAFGEPGLVVFPGNNGLPRNLWKTTWTDFGPRVGLSYQPMANLVLRGGYGISYQPNNTGWYDGPYNYGTVALATGAINRDYGTSPNGTPVGHFYDSVSSAIIPAAGTNSAAPQVYGAGSPYFNYNSEKPPLIQQWNVFLEQQVRKDWIVTMGYVGSRGSNLQFGGYPLQNDQLIPSSVSGSWRQTYIASAATGGAHNPGSDQVPNPLQPTSGPLLPFQNTLGSSTIPRNITYYPYLALYPDVLSAGNGESNYNSLLLHLRHANTNGLLLDVSYVWSKSTDDTYTDLQDEEGFSDTAPTGSGSISSVDLLHPGNNKKISFSDIPQRFTALVTYRLPFGKDGRYALGNPIARGVLGGWTIGGVVLLEDGSPLPPSNSGCSGAMNCRPNRTGEPFELPKSYQHWYDGSTTVTLPDGRSLTPCSQCYLKYNPDAFGGNIVSLPSGGTVNDIYWTGNASLDYSGMRGPGRSNVDLSLSRAFTVREKVTLSFSANASNAFNHTQFLPNGYVMDLGGILATTGGGSTAGQGASNVYGTHSLATFDPRQIVLEGRIQF